MSSVMFFIHIRVIRGFALITVRELKTFVQENSYFYIIGRCTQAFTRGLLSYHYFI